MAAGVGRGALLSISAGSIDAFCMTALPTAQYSKHHALEVLRFSHRKIKIPTFCGTSD